jgi:asparagine synthetase B (glutamine-hydrolysing)
LEPGEDANVRRAFEQVLLAALQKPPTVVAFSGGRDSSGVLALATVVARRHGLALPVAVTNTFPGDAAAEESLWQEKVVRHLGLPHWERLSWSDELDLVGPVAQEVLRRFGPVFPMNAHFIVPGARAAGTGTVLTGVGGDELFLSSSFFSLVRQVPRRWRRGLVRVAGAMAPYRLRRALYRLGLPQPPWLVPAARQEVRRALAEWLAATPYRWSDLVLGNWWRSRARLGIERTLAAVGAMSGATVVNPFMAPEVLRAAARAHPLAGFPDRARGMEEIFGDVLPIEVLERSTKAMFDGAFFSTYSRRFSREWDGRGAEGLPVDHDGLVRTWAANQVDARSFSLLQGLWCRSNGILAGNSR